VVDAQQTLFEAEWQHVEALAACHAAVAEIERTAGPRTNR
jgi:outer membrane protein TolC